MDKISLIGIAGGSASGKGYIAKQLAQNLTSKGAKVAVICADDYYKDVSHLTKEQLRHYDFDCPEAIAFDELVSDIKMILNHKVVKMRKYDFISHKAIRDPNHFIDGSRIDKLIVEGLFVLYVPAIRNMCDKKIFVDASSSTRLQRRMKRDVAERGISPEETIRIFKTIVEPAHIKYVQSCKKYADTVIDNN